MMERDVEGRFAAELAWAAEHIVCTGPPVARERPWSTVLRLPTADGPVWLKAGAGCEAALYGVLAECVPDRVLVPLARDDEQGWLLLPDGGPTAHDGPVVGLAARVTAAMGAYAELQRTVAGHRDDLLAAGVPDASPGALLDRYDEAVRLISVSARGEDAELRAPSVSDGASLARRGAIADYAERLADAPGADLATIDHQDLHTGNILTGKDGPRFYDWGDAAVAHPFASLLTGIGALARALGVPADDPAVVGARDAYLERFTDLAAHAELVATANLACRAAVVARALTWQRAIGDLGPDHPYAGTPGQVLSAIGSGSPFDVP